MTSIEKVIELQKLLGVSPDGDIGKRTRAAFEALDSAADSERIIFKTTESDPRIVKASSFADPADVRAFKACKAQGNSDQFCFSKGDNGVGKWGHNCADEDMRYAALPREVWAAAGKTGGAPMAVTYRGQRVTGSLGDTMPSLANIKNGAGLDLNPGFQKAFGLKPPFLLDGFTWEWI